MKKRGQVTIFVLIALILLFVLVGVYFVKEIFLEQRLFSEIQEPGSIPSQIQSVNLYVDTCIDAVALDGIGLLGLQGGYIDVPQDPLPVSVANPFSNGVALPGLKVPYWYYEDFNGEPINLVPSLEDMNRALARYMEENLDSCISNFEDLEEGFEIDEGNVVSDVEIKENEVYVKVRYPLDIKKEGTSYSLSDHVQTYPTKLGRMYEQALTLINDENEKFWLENRSLEILHVYEKEIPNVVLDFGCSPLVYSELEIAKNFKQALLANVPLYYVKGSNTQVSGEFEELSWNVKPVDPELSVDFFYDYEWPIMLNVEPSQGDVILLEPFEGSIVFGTLCVNYEQLFYDIKHPLIISVRDTEGNLFQYGVLVTIKTNEARGSTEIASDTTLGYCDLRNIPVTVQVEGVGQTGVVAPLEEADVFYRCVSNNCYIGRTDLGGYLEGMFPTCGNGEINVKKEGYAESSTTLTTFDGGERAATLSLESFVERPFNVKVYDLVNNILVGPRDLTSEEKAILQISYEFNGRTVFGDVGIVPGEINDTLSLVPTAFYLKGNLIKTTPTFIEGKTIERCTGPEILGVCSAGTETVEIPSETVESVILGGVELDWKILVNELYTSKGVEIYLINKGVPSTLEDLDLTFDVSTLTKGHEQEVMPKFYHE